MADEVIANPTYFGNIRHFFDPEDLEHMGRLGVDLSTYEALRDRATSVYFRTKPPNPSMPPDPARHWSAERSETFANWIRNGFSLGDPIPVEPTEVEAARVARTRGRSIRRRSNRSSWPSRGSWTAMRTIPALTSFWPEGTGFRRRPNACTTRTASTRGIASM
jgi:hypothetical protein